MLKKLNLKDKDGNELYQEMLNLGKENNFTKVYGKIGTLKKLSSLPMNEKLTKGLIKTNQ